ncbi:MAG: NTP transferase domain-containing protein [Candidatus Latescibacteria bacterium]|nr:NTP transferase domain-containing protein [Candidatus Latescibacterota bacterium]
MKGIIPVAGIGSRLRPHTHTTPKALMHVAGKPILGYILDELVALGVQEVTLIIGNMGQKIIDYVNTQYAFNAHYVVQHETCGIAHAIHLGREHFDDEPVLIILGDTIFNSDFSHLRAHSNLSAIGVKPMQGDIRRFGVVEVEDNRVVRLVEKPEHPRSNLVIAGVYYIACTPVFAQCLDDLIRTGRTTRGEYQLTDALQLMVERDEPLITFTVDEWYDCGKPETLLETNRRLLELRATPRRIDGSIILPPVSIADDAQIMASVIGPFVSIAGGAIVQHSVISNSIISEGATVQDCLLEGSLIGDRAVVKGSYLHLNVGDSSEVSF